MFQEILNAPLRILTLGARQHALINRSMMKEIRAAFEAGDWTCHVCGVRIPGLMEVDHIKGHNLSGKAALAPICQFCHDLKHPLWAASRGRFVPVAAPGFDQASITRFSWTLLSEGLRKDSFLDVDDVREALDEREDAAWEILGGDNIESAFEALYTIRDRRGEDKAQKVARALDASLRFVPSDVKDLSSPSRWTREGFRQASSDVLHDGMGSLPDRDALFRAAREVA